MIRVERREFSGLKIYDSLLCKFFFWSQCPSFCHQTAPETRQNKVSIVEAFEGRIRFDTPKIEAGVALTKLLRHCRMALWRTLNTLHRISVHSQNELLKY